MSRLPRTGSRRSFLGTVTAAFALGPKVLQTRAATPQDKDLLAHGPLTAGQFAGAEAMWLASERTLWRVGWPTLLVQGSWPIDLDKISAMLITGWPTEADQATLWLAGGTPGERGRIVACDFQGRALEAVDAGDDLIRCLAYDAPGRVLYGGSQLGAIHRWQLSEVSKPQSPASRLAAASTLQRHSGPVTAIQSLPDHGLLSAGLDQSLRVWRSDNVEPIRTLEQHTDGVSDLLRVAAASNGQPQFVSLGRDKTLRLWQPTIGRQVRLARLPEKGQVLCPGRSAEEVLVGSEDGRLLIVDTRRVSTRTSDRLGPTPITLLRKHPNENQWLVAGTGWARRVTQQELPT